VTVGGRELVTGHYAGAVTRFGAFLLDWFLIGTTFGLGVGAVSLITRVITRTEFDLGRARGLVWVLAAVAWAFVYMTVSLAVAGRTPGKAIVGLRVVNRDGSPLAARRALVRVLTFPLSFLVFGFGFVGIVFGNERRALHDVIARTAVVYDWGERRAELPAPLTRWLERRHVDESLTNGGEGPR
jgi:uncharacterized RDD family membrane protein YckC